jgi:radical SAM superfamily enzyme YgiQ (UPF0313 family)
VPPLGGGMEIIMKICLISINTQKFPSPVVPIGASIIYNTLKKENEVDFYDLCFLSEDYVLHKIEKTDYEVICISIRNLDNENMNHSESYLPVYKSFVNKIRKVFHKKIILGGAGFNVMPKAVLDYLEADIGFYGEGEEKICEVVRNCNNNEWLKQQTYIVTLYDVDKNYMFYKCNIKENPIQPEITCYDEKYHCSQKGIQPSISIQTRRGCSYYCSYCKTPIIEGDKIRMKNISDVISELHHIENCGFDEVFFVDNVFNFPRDYAETLCKEMIREKINLKWMGYFVPQNFTPDFAELLARSGCNKLQFGTDHLCDYMLRKLYKTYTFKDIQVANKVCQDAGMICVHSILFGAFGETNETIIECMKRLIDLQPNIAFINSGIRLYDRTPITSQIEVDRERNRLFPEFYFSEKVNIEQARSDINFYIDCLKDVNKKIKIINSF